MTEELGNILKHIYVEDRASLVVWEDDHDKNVEFVCHDDRYNKLVRRAIRQLCKIKIIISEYKGDVYYTFIQY